MNIKREENRVVSKHLTFVSDCAPAVIAIAVYRKEDVDLRIKRRAGCSTGVARASNDETLRAFGNANRFTTFKIRQ
jgi:hypothetical protein